MGLLHEIQESVVQDGSQLGPVLLKLQLLAARLGSEPLEKWVTYESEGYPSDVPVPSYRQVGVSYRGTFIGPFGRTLESVQIPGYLIEKFAGTQWVTHEVRDGIATVDELVRSSAQAPGNVGIDASNLILLLQGKVYEGFACAGVRGTIAAAALTNLQHAVRSRILELTLQLEKAIPEAGAITFGSPQSEEKSRSQEATRIYQQVVYGNLTAISSSGAGSQINVSNAQGDQAGLLEYLVRAGVPVTDASEFAGLVAAEEPSGPGDVLGAEAKAWLLKNLKKAADGTWKIGMAALMTAVTEAVLRYYGLK